MDDTVDDILAHYGVRGMKWGVRRSSGSRASADGTTTKPKWAVSPTRSLNGHSVLNAKVKVKSKHEVSDDDVVFNALRSKARKTGISSLTNDEIRVLTNRADSLAKYHRAFPKKRSKKAALANFVIQEMLIDNGKQLVKEAAKHHLRTAGVKKGLLPKKDKTKENADD